MVRRVLTLFSAGRQLFYALTVSKTVLYLVHTCIYITTSINKMNYTRKSESWAIHCPPPPQKKTFVVNCDLLGVLLACDFCRHRKRRCDGGQPCSTCQDANADCIYKELPVDRWVFRARIPQAPLRPR